MPESEGQVALRVGLQYSLESTQNYNGVPPLTKERLRTALSMAAENSDTNASTFKKKGKSGSGLRRALVTAISELPPVLIDQALQAAKVDIHVAPRDAVSNEALMDALLKSLSEAREVVEDITSSATCKGYILATRKNDLATPIPDTDKASDSTSRENLLYDDFHPFLPLKAQNDSRTKVLEIEGYNKTVDEFFSSLEGQKLELRLSEREATAQRRIDAAKQDQAKRVEGLQEAQHNNFRRAAAIEANIERVQEAMDAINGLLAQSMDWVDIGKLVEREKKRNNPVAEIIKLPLNLAENQITVQLAEEEPDEETEDPFETDESDSEEEQGTASCQGEEPTRGLAVELNLTLSPWGNAREYHDQRRTAAVKEEKTQLQTARALKNTEKKIAEDLKKGLKQEKALLQPIRQQMWFEKFLWFISSDGYLVIGGRDAQQNEMLYRKYLRKGDVYCHADLRGASSIVIKNNPETPQAPIPPATLSQAGSLCVCSSDAWDSKAGMGAWWVSAEQVSKSAGAGEYLPAGSFTVRGEKNFLPPSQLLLGVGVLFKISEESKVKHVKHRLHDDNTSLEPSSDRQASDRQRGYVREQDSRAETSGSKNENTDANVDNNVGYDSEDASNADEFEEQARDNPLQNSVDNETIEDMGEVDKAVSVMNILDKPAAEIDSEPDQRELHTDKSEGETEQDVDIHHEEVRMATEDGPVMPKTSGTDTQSTRDSSRPSAAKQAPYKRGQKAKAKKISRKYRDQDEEDRAAAEALIGATAGQKKKEAEARVKAEREAEMVALKERRREQLQRQQQKTAEHEEMRRAMMEDGVEMLDEDEVERLPWLDNLVGTPLAGDEIVEAIPVCAPWTAMGKFKYKAKLQPGATKKGRAVKDVLEKWRADAGRKGAMDESAQDTEKMWPREVELIKAMKPEEIVNVVPVSKVRVMMAMDGGGAKVKGKGVGKGPGKSGGRGGRGSKR